MLRACCSRNAACRLLKKATAKSTLRRGRVAVKNSFINADEKCARFTRALLVALTHRRIPYFTAPLKKKVKKGGVMVFFGGLQTRC